MSWDPDWGERDTVDRILESEKLTRKALLPSGGAEPDLVRKVTEKLAAALEVQGFLVALLPGEKLQRTAVLNLLAAGNTVADTWDVSFTESASYMRFLAAVDRRATLYRPWTGLITVDTLLEHVELDPRARSFIPCAVGTTRGYASRLRG